MGTLQGFLGFWWEKRRPTDPLSAGGGETELKLRGVIDEVGCDMPPRQLQCQKATEMRPAAFITAVSWHERARCKMLAGPEANRE